MARALHDTSADDRSRTASRPRADETSRHRRPALHVVGGTAAMELDRRLLALAGRAARCRFAEGRLAAPLLARRGWTALGFVRLADYARERLGIGARAVEESVRVVTALESLPRVAAAFLDGTLSWTATRLVTGIASARDEAEWIRKARRMETRALEARVRQARAPASTPGATTTPSEDPGDDPRVRWSVRVSGLGRRMWRAAHELAERTTGSRLTQAQVLELVAAEASGSVPPAVDHDPSKKHEKNVEPDPAIRDLADGHPSEMDPQLAAVLAAADAERARTHSNGTDAQGAPMDQGADDAPDAGDGTGDRPTFASLLREIAEREGFSWLVPPLPADAADPSASSEPHIHAREITDPFVIDERLREVRRRAERLDFDLASLLREAARRRLYRDFGFANLEHYVESRLGICPRTAWTLLAIERACSRKSARLADAWREGRISTMAAHAILHVLGHGHDEDWIDRAAAVTLRRLEAEVEWARARLSQGGTGNLPPDGLDLAGDRLAGITIEELQMRAHGARGEEAAAGPSAAEELQMRAHEALAFFAPKSVCSLAEDTMLALRVGPETRGCAFERLLALALLEWMAPPPHRDPVFERDGWRCSVPGCTSRRNLHDHHIVFRSHGGGNARDNRITVCAAHHLHGLHRGRIRAHGRAPGDITWEMPLFRTVGDRYVGPQQQG